MIKFESLVYLDVYKTGSSHVIDLLRNILDEREIALKRHKDLHWRPTGKVVFTTVRNPWDWYVSLWSSGTDKRSLIRRYILRALGKKAAKAFYDKDGYPESFRHWMRFIHDSTAVSTVIRQHYPESKLAGFMGLYTYRFLQVTTFNRNLFLRRWRIHDAQAVGRFHERRKAYDCYIRTEDLEGGLIDLVHRYRDRCRFKRDAVEQILAAKDERRNASPRISADYRDYYDEATCELITVRDPLFIEHFGYRF